VSVHIVGILVFDEFLRYENWLLILDYLLNFRFRFFIALPVFHYLYEFLAFHDTLFQLFHHLLSNNGNFFSFFLYFTLFLG